MGAVEQHLTYARELQPGDCLRVTTHVVEVKPKAITFRHEMTEVTSGDVVSACTITAVHIDTSTRRASALREDVSAAASGMLMSP